MTSSPVVNVSNVTLASRFRSSTSRAPIMVRKRSSLPVSLITRVASLSPCNGPRPSMVPTSVKVLPSRASSSKSPTKLRSPLMVRLPVRLSVFGSNSVAEEYSIVRLLISEPSKINVGSEPYNSRFDVAIIPNLPPPVMEPFRTNVLSLIFSKAVASPNERVPSRVIFPSSVRFFPLAIVKSSVKVNPAPVFLNVRLVAMVKTSSKLPSGIRITSPLLAAPTAAEMDS